MNLEKELNEFVRKFGKEKLYVLVKHYNNSKKKWVRKRFKQIYRFRSCPFCNREMEIGVLEAHIKAKHPNQNISLSESIKLLRERKKK